MALLGLLAKDSCGDGGALAGALLGLLAKDSRGDGGALDKGREGALLPGPFVELAHGAQSRRQRRHGRGATIAQTAARSATGSTPGWSQK